MRSVSRGWLIVGLLAAALGFASNARAQARITGTVVDDAGKAIKAATVTAESTNLGVNYTATTDEKGHFTMIGLRPGGWRLVASAPGYLPEAGEVQVRAGGTNPPVTIGIRRGAPVFGALGNVSARDLQTDLAAADTLFGQKRWDESIVAYRAILAKTPSLTAIALQVASAFSNKGDHDSALAAYREALRLNPTSERAMLGIATESTARGDRRTAEATLTEAANGPGAGRSTFYSLGDLKFESNDTTEAVKWYQQAAKADPSWGKPLYKLGLVAMKQGDKAAAADFMTRAMTVDPLSPEATLAKAAIDQLNR